MTTESETSSAAFQIVRGIQIPKLSWFKKKSIEDAMDYVPKDGDVILTSYPKTGTTWLQYIVLQVVSKATQFYSFDDMTFKIFPFIEMCGAAGVEALTGSRIYKYHLPYNVIQKNMRSKCIYIYRNPEDTAVSYYHFFQNLGFYVSLSFDEFFNEFLSGNVSYGSYFEHVLSFYQHRNDPNLLMVSYEKLHAEKKEEILKIAKFLGEEHYSFLIEHEDILDKIIEHTSFEHMKQNLYLTQPEPTQEKKTVNFFRKGVVGDGRNTLSEEQRERMKQVAKETLEGTSILKEWYEM